MVCFSLSILRNSCLSGTLVPTSPRSVKRVLFFAKIKGGAPASALPVYAPQDLLYVIVGFVVVDHPFAHNLHRLQFFEHDSLTALGAEATGQMVNLFAVRQRGTCCF